MTHPTAPADLTFTLTPLEHTGDVLLPPEYLEFWYRPGGTDDMLWRKILYPRYLGGRSNRVWFYITPPGLYELQRTTRITHSFNPKTNAITLTIPGHGKGSLLARHNAGHFNNAPLWKSHAEAARHIVAATPALADSEWHLTALRNDCVHSFIQAIYDGLSGQEVFLAIQNEAAAAIADLAHHAADCYFPISSAGVVSRHATYASNEAAETAYKAFAARVVADKDATTPALRHDMNVAAFKAAFPAPPPPPPVEPPAPPPPPAPEVSSVSITATSTNYRTGNPVTASVVRVRATGGTIHWQVKQPGRLGWADLQTDDSPPVAVTGATWIPTAEGMYRAEIRGAVAPNGDTIPTAQSPEFTITPA